MPSPSIAAEGNGGERKPPATSCTERGEIWTDWLQLAPPSSEIKDRMSPKPQNGTTTRPLGSTSGWPPRPLAASAVVIGSNQVAPPSVEVVIKIRPPSETESHSM